MELAPVSQLHDATHDPSPKPETKVEMAALKTEQERLSNTKAFGVNGEDHFRVIEPR